MARYDDEEEKWGTAEGIITGRAPYRGGAVIPPEIPEGIPKRAWETAERYAGAVGSEYRRGIKAPIERHITEPAGRAYEQYIKKPIESGILEPIRRDISYIATGERRAALSPTVTQDLSREVTDRVLDRTADYTTRVEGRTRPSAPVVPPSSLESVWGIGREVLPTGATRYTVPGEGIMTAEPETEATRRGDEIARRGVISRIGAETAERERGIETQMENEIRLREESIQRQRYEEGTAERQRRQDLGLEPKLGYAAYEEAAKRMREGVIPPKERAAIEVARIGAVGEREKARLRSEGVISAAGVKAQTEAAKLGIQAADVKSKMQLRQAQMDQMLTQTGLLEPMKLKLQGARDAVSRTKIQRDTLESANKQIYEKETKALETQFGIGQIDLATYNAELRALTQAMAARQSLIIKAHALEGDVLEEPEGRMVMRNGIWVDVKTGKAQ